LKDLEDEIDKNLQKLKAGYLNFVCPEEMTLGTEEAVTVEIFRDRKFLDPVISPDAIDEIKVGQTMSVKLIGKDFEISSKNNESQIILPNEKTAWQWDVKPLKHGSRKLEVVVTVKLKLESKDEVYDYPLLTKDITVEINRVYITKKFVEKNWQWMASTFVGSGVLFGLLKGCTKNG